MSLQDGALPSEGEGAGAGSGAAAGAVDTGTLPPDRWAAWDDGLLRSYLYTCATNEKRQKRLAAAITRPQLMELVDKWMVAYVEKGTFLEQAGGLGGVRRKIMDIWGEAEAGNIRSVQLYVDQGEQLDRPAPNNRRRTPLHCAASGGNAACVRAFAEAGAKLEARDMDRYTPLHLAVRKGRVEAVVRNERRAPERGLHVMATLFSLMKGVAVLLACR
jgi:hypothetical protein